MAAQWAEIYGGAAEDSSGGVWPAGDGNYNMSGTTTSFGAGGGDGIFAKLDPLGRVSWAKTVGGNDDDVLIIHETAGGFFVTGTTKSFSADGNWNIVWAKFDASWAPVYQKILTGSGTMVREHRADLGVGVLVPGQILHAIGGAAGRGRVFVVEWLRPGDGAVAASDRPRRRAMPRPVRPAATPAKDFAIAP